MSWFNLFLVFVPSYAIIWIAMVVINRNRTQPVEDPALYEIVDRKRMVQWGFYPQIALVLASLFIPIQSGIQVWIGLGLAVLGTGLSVMTIAAFGKAGQGLTTIGLYRFSRNPMYVAGLLLILGLNSMAFALSWWYLLFVGMTLVWMIGTHWCVLQEEIFLRKKYGAQFSDFERRVHRYL